MTLVWDHETDFRDFTHVDFGLRLRSMHDASLDRMTDDIVAHDNLHVDGRAGLRECVSMLVANLLKVYCADPLRLLNIPFGRSIYTTSRYVPSAFSYRKMVQVRDYLLIDTHYARFAPGYFHAFTGNSRTSKLRCTPRLFEYFNPGGRTLNYPQSISLLNNRNTSLTSGDISSWSLFNIERTEAVDPIVLRKTEPIAHSRRREKKVWLPYDETAETTRMRANIREWNKLLSRHWIDLLLSDSDQNISHSDQVDTPPPFPEDLDLGQPALSRKFANGSFDKGGRFYDGWWQEIPSKCRQYITINWDPTRELDYASMEASILYAMVGSPLEGDAYELDEVDRTKANRKLVKTAFFKMINSQQRRIAAPDSLPTRSDDPSRTITWPNLQRAVKRRHAPILRYFGSGIGVETQRTDSDVAEDVMLSMARQDILVLPVHDSFIVPWMHYETLKTEMLRAYREKLAAEPTIRIDPSFVDVELANGNTDVLCNDTDRVNDFTSQIEHGPGCERYLERRNDVHAMWWLNRERQSV